MFPLHFFLIYVLYVCVGGGDIRGQITVIISVSTFSGVGLRDQRCIVRLASQLSLLNHLPSPQ